MTANRRLWNTETGQVRPYPRLDGQDVVGLEDPPWKVLRVQATDPPEHNTAREIAKPHVEIDEEALLLIQGWEIVQKPPDFQGFYNALINSEIYTRVVAQQGKTGDQAFALSLFSTALTQAKDVEENRPALQAAIWNFLATLQLPQADLEQVGLLMEAHRLSPVYSVYPP